MKVTYVLGYPELGGGVKVVFQHAEILQNLGHTTTILGIGEAPTWISFGGQYIDYSRGLPPLPHQDLIIATYWTTIEVAEKLQSGSVVHFCQGYEGNQEHLVSDVPMIEAVYQKMLPTFVVQPVLGRFIEQRFDRKTFVVSPPIDPMFHPRLRIAPQRKPRILINGIFEAASKGVPVALKVICQLQQLGLPCEVIRISTFPLSEKETAIIQPDEYHFKIHPSDVAKILRNSDLVIYTATEDEGFGLPLLEAMVSQVPVVASDTPVNRFITQGAIPLFSVDNIDAIAREAYRILRNPVRWHWQRRQAYHVAQRFSPSEITRQLRDGIEWAVSQLQSDKG